jgi:hypothetical protein
MPGVKTTRTPAGPSIVTKERFLVSMTTLSELFGHELKDIYYAEHQLVEALQTLADESSDGEIKEGLSVAPQRDPRSYQQAPATHDAQPRPLSGQDR